MKDRTIAAGRPNADSVAPIQRAIAYGIDISLLRSNLQRSVAERLNALDANAAFVRAVRGERNDRI